MITDIDILKSKIKTLKNEIEELEEEKKHIQMDLDRLNKILKEWEEGND